MLQETQDTVGFGLTKQEKGYLLRQVKDSIKARLDGSDLPADIPESKVLKEKRGGFVTLKKKPFCATSKS